MCCIEFCKPNTASIQGVSLEYRTYICAGINDYLIEYQWLTSFRWSSFSKKSGFNRKEFLLAWRWAKNNAMSPQNHEGRLIHYYPLASTQQPSREVVFKLQHVLASFGGLVNAGVDESHPQSFWFSLGWGLRICISNTFPGDAAPGKNSSLESQDC